eukprot:Awhi_evm1s780
MMILMTSFQSFSDCTDVSSGVDAGVPVVINGEVGVNSEVVFDPNPDKKYAFIVT